MSGLSRQWRRISSASIAWTPDWASSATRSASAWRAAAVGARPRFSPSIDSTDRRGFNFLVTSLKWIEDRHGNRLSIYRNNTGLVTKTVTPNGRWLEFEYAAPTCLNCVSRVNDNAGRRKGKTLAGVTTRYLYDGANPIQEKQGWAATADLLAGPALDKWYARTAAGQTHRHLPDALGSTLKLTDPSQAIVAGYTHAPQEIPLGDDNRFDALTQA